MSTLVSARRDSEAGYHGDPSVPIIGGILASVLLVAWLHPHPLVLPLLSIILVTGAVGMAAFVAIKARMHRERLAVDRFLAPAIVLFCGFAAAMIGDPDLAVQSLSAKR